MIRLLLIQSECLDQLEKKSKIETSDTLGQVFGEGFSEEDRNKLVKEAENHTRKLASQLTENLKSDVQSSAKNTLEAIARGFDVKTIQFEFSNNS
jgi:hypothetical protein